MQTWTPPPTLATVRDTADALAGHLEPPPLVPLGEHLWGKAEYAQPTGSFKVRGGLAAALHARRAGHRAVVAASAGNHGAGLAWGGARAGVEVCVVVPPDCPDVKVANMRAHGATVRLASLPGYDAAEAEARALAAERGVPFVSPFDDPIVMAANGGSLLLELVRQLPPPFDLVVPVGGGGLLSGVLATRAALALDVRVVAVQSEACPAFARSLRDGVVHDRWPPVETLAEGLEGGAGATSVHLAREHEVPALLVSEAAIARAMRALHTRLGVWVEGSGAVTWAAVDSLPPASEARPRILVLSGGNVSPGTVRRLPSPDAAPPGVP